MSSGSGKTRRQELIAAIEVAMRDSSGHGVLYSQAVAQRIGINSTDLECLDLIVLRGPITAGALAEATGLTTGAITGVIDRLERAGFARRTRDDQDRRKVLVQALPTVGERIEPLFAPMLRAAMTTLTAYSDEELALLLDFFRRIREASLNAMAEMQAVDLPGKSPQAKAKAGKKL
jgi:DNA-binding MarR family transcriptional regulator